MVDVNPDYQSFFDLPDGTTVGVTKFKTLNANNTVHIAPGIYTSQGAAGQQLKDTGDTSQIGWFYLSPSGDANLNNVSSANLNKNVTFITIHKTSNGVGA